MTSASSAPSVVLKPSGLQPREFIECSRCLDAGRDEVDNEKWATDHEKRRRGHNTFRTVSTSSWRLVPRESPAP